MSSQDSTKESPFFLLHGRDPRIPTETVLSHVRNPFVIDLDEYKEELLSGMSLAWKLASEHIQKARVTQKVYDKNAREADLSIGKRVKVLMPSKFRGRIGNSPTFSWPLSCDSSHPYKCRGSSY